MSENKCEIDILGMNNYCLETINFMREFTKNNFLPEDKIIHYIYFKFQVDLCEPTIFYKHFRIKNQTQIELPQIDWIQLFEKNLRDKWFDYETFHLNLNFFIISVIRHMRAWYIELSHNIISTMVDLNHSKRALAKKTPEIARITYRVSCLLLDIYNFYDAFNYHLVLISKNYLITAWSVHDMKRNPNNQSKLRNMKLSGKESFGELCNLINEIQAKAQIRGPDFETLAKMLHLIETEELSDIQWIVNQRNYMTHNYISLDFDNAFLSKNQDKYTRLTNCDYLKKLKIIFILLTNFSFLFLAVLAALGCLE